MPADFSTVHLRGPVLALDLGATNARAGVVTPAGRLTVRHAGAIPVAQGVRAVVDHCLGLLRQARDEHLAAGGAEPIAVGIAAPGPLDPAAGRLIDPPNLRDDWWGFPLAPTLGEALGLPWAMGKDTNVNILGERDFGAGEGSGDLIYLTISTGVGGAILSGGRPIVGPDGVAGELGHMTVDLDGPTCGCGGVGHLEALASGTGIAANARAALDAGADAPVLARIAAEIDPLPLTAVHVSRAADLGDPAAGVIIDRARRAVAVAVVSIVNVFGPDVVILGGGITLAWGERLIAPAREAVARTAFRIQAERARVVQAALGDDVGLIGTVPLVASALPASLDQADHQGAAAVSADAIT
ncbi:MAG: ROK family protein [Candidatus Limnocylindrales bacterium]